MKIYFIINLNVKEKGGVFQFFTALKKHFKKFDLVTENPDEADVFFVSASQFALQVLKLKLKYRDKVFVHRIDGPIRLYNSMSDTRDSIVNIINYYIADATVFQSQWSRFYSKILGIENKLFETVIINAPDPSIFNKDNKQDFDITKKIKLISTSWSSNKNKGFDTYKWLDDNLDFDRYEYTFIGNSPIKFNNIKHLKPLDSNELSEKLKSSDIFISASKIEACSNALLEALHTGLPSIAFNSSSNPEIVKNKELLFNDASEIPKILVLISSNYHYYKDAIDLPKFEEVANQYLEFIKKVKVKGKNKKFSYALFMFLVLKLYILKIKNKLI